MILHKTLPLYKSVSPVLFYSNSRIKLSTCNTRQTNTFTAVLPFHTTSTNVLDTLVSPHYPLQTLDDSYINSTFMHYTYTFDLNTFD